MKLERTENIFRFRWFNKAKLSDIIMCKKGTSLGTGKDVCKWKGHIFSGHILKIIKYVDRFVWWDIQPNILIKFILNRTEGLSVANWGWLRNPYRDVVCHHLCKSGHLQSQPFIGQLTLSCIKLASIIVDNKNISARQVTSEWVNNPLLFLHKCVFTMHRQRVYIISRWWNQH